MELASPRVVSEAKTLAAIGLNHRSAVVPVRKRSWASEVRRYEALHKLARALKQAPENAGQDILTAAIRQLFHLHRSQAHSPSR
jgi:hypothetical protein